MATQQAESMDPAIAEADADMASSTTQGPPIGNERYRSDVASQQTDSFLTASKDAPNLSPVIQAMSSLSQTEIHGKRQVETRSDFGQVIGATSADGGSPADIDELDEGQSSSNEPITPITPAGVLEDLSRSQGSPIQASAAMSSTSSSTMTSSASSVTAASEPNRNVATSQLDSIAIAPMSSAAVPLQREPSASQVPKRQRIPRACDSCRRKKIRCNLSTAVASAPDKGQVCANCHQSGVHCTFTKSPAKRGPNKGYIQQLETRLAALESSVSNDGPSDAAGAISEADLSRTARTQGLLSSTGVHQAHHYSIPYQKKARVDETMAAPGSHHFHPQHPLHAPTTTLPFVNRTPTNETWSRTTIPPTLHSANAFFLSSADGNVPRHAYPHYAPQAQPSDSASQYSPRSALPPISRLLSTLPPPEKQNWSSQPETSYADVRGQSSSKYGYHQPYPSGQRDPEASHPQVRHEDDDFRPIRKIPSRQPSYSNSAHYSDYVPSKSTSSPRLSKPEYSRDPAFLQLPAQRAQYTSFEGSRPGRSPSIGSSASVQQSVSDYSPQQQDTRLRWPAALASPSNGPSNHSTSLLSRLDKSAVLSLDSPAFRRAVFETPAMRTFSILPPSLLEEGFQGCAHLIKAAHLLSTSSATLAYEGDMPDDSQWQSDSSAVIGESMVPMKFDASGSEMTCREIESLMMCYVDALRRGKLIAGILGAISGKLAILETRGLPCKRYQAVGILLAVWHTVGYSSRRMYFGTPSTTGPDALYNALETQDPTILAICIFTYNLDKMCRRYSQSGETYVPPESIEFTRVIAASLPEPLPKAQLRLLSILDAFLLALNFAYNQSPTALPSMEALERQRHHLHSIVNDADSSDILGLLIGPHVLAMVACATLYCLAACRERGETETEADQKQNIRTLERDYLSILDALRNMTIALSATPDASLVNSHPYADGGDMRLLYGQIARFVQVNLAAAVSSSKQQVSASQFIGNLHSLGYLGTVLAAGQEIESVSV